MPQRSPMPLIVPCTCTAPCSTAIRLLATASSESLWQWMPSGVGTAAATASTPAAISSGRRPPLVSQRQSRSAPASAAARDALERVRRVVAEAVEEVLGVEDHLVDVALEVAHGVVDDLEVGLLRDAQIVAHVQVPGLAEDGHHRRLGAQQLVEVVVLAGACAGAPRRAEGGDARCASASACAPRGRTPRRAGWSPASRLRRRRCRSRRGAR